jgi:hypothetical protein
MAAGQSVVSVATVAVAVVIGRIRNVMRPVGREEALNSIRIKNFTLQTLEPRFFAKLEWPAF